MNYGDYWKQMKESEWATFHKSKEPMHQHFDAWLKDHPFDTALEVGCGFGAQARLSFGGRDYVGVDISGTGISLAEEKSKDKTHDFIAGDIMTPGWHLPKFDLVFCINVIDHVADPNAFILKLMNLAKKCVYIMAYNTHQNEMKEHEIKELSGSSCYLNTLSIPKLKEIYNCKITYAPNGETVIEIWQ